MAALRLGDIPRVIGTSTRSRYPEISFGNTAVDTLIGGGLPLSAICIIDETESRVYAAILAKYFIAEGVCSGHSLFVASATRNPRKLLEKLPSKVTNMQNSGTTVNDASGEDLTMKIAWRYSNVPKVDSSLDRTQQRATHFDLTEQMDHDKVEACVVGIFPNSPGACRGFPCYSDLYRKIQTKLVEREFSIYHSKSLKNILRITIEGVSSPLWQDPENDMKFVSHLRSILNSSLAVAILIVNTSGMDADRRERLYSYGDLVIHLKTADNIAAVKKLGDSFDGYFRLIKLPSVASVASHCPASSDLVFQLHKRKFDVRVLHLPPVFDDSSGRSVVACFQNTLDCF